MMNFLFIFTICFSLGYNFDTANGLDMAKACKENLGYAKAYCRPKPEDEPPAVKPKCDLYRKHCKDLLASTPSPAKCGMIGYCSQYARQNSLICSNENFANSNTENQQFCANYKAKCADVPDDPNDSCGLKKGNPPPKANPNPFNGPPQTPGLVRPTDFNGGGPLATVGQSSLDRIPENMVKSAASAPVFGIVGHMVGQAGQTAGSALPNVASGNFGGIGQNILSAPPPAAVAGPPNPSGPALGIQTVPGFDPASQAGPFGTHPIFVGNSVGVGPFVQNAGQSTFVNPFGKVGSGTQANAFGFNTYKANGVDFGSIHPGLGDINNPLFGGKRRRREALKRIDWYRVYRFLYKV